MADFTHIDADGNALMVDVSDKDITERTATAGATITMQPETLALIQEGRAKKGDVLGTARLAGIMAAKKTSDLVPLCHPLALTHVTIELTTNPELPGVHCEARVETRSQTGVEMEALCATQVALLTIYDMCKAADRGMSIDQVRLVEKAGGKSGHWRRD